MQKKISYFFLAVFFISCSLSGQRHEIGVQLGMSNLVGDIGRTNYIFQKPAFSNIREYGIPFYGSILYRRNFNPYQSVRLNLGYSHLQFIDGLAKENYRRNRNLWGTNSAFEADLLFEYNFFPVNEEHESLLSPYIFGGVGALLADNTQLTVVNDFGRDAAGAPDKNTVKSTPAYTSDRKLTMAIPFGVGLKYKFNYNWALFGELMFRPTFSDTIDYSVIDENSVKLTYADPELQEGRYQQIINDNAAAIIKNRQIGDVNSKDWINSFSIGLSYSFGRPPCYCN